MADMGDSGARIGITIVLFCILVIEVGSSFQLQNVKMSQAKEWSEKISMKLNTSSMGESMGFSNFIEVQYNKAESYITFEKNNGVELVKEMATQLEKMLGKKMAALKDLVNAAETAVRDHKWREDMRIGDVQYWDAKNHSQLHDILSYNERFLQSINESVSTVHIPVEIYNGNIDILNGLKWSNDLDQAFMKNYENDPDILWQYFGSQTGFMRTFPGSKWSIKHDDVDLFDVRRRPWYTQGSSSPKDMLILIDTSGSVHGQALSLIKVAVKSILDTLGENDFVNIANFSKSVTFVSCFETFVQANHRNKKILKEGVDALTAKDMANYESALTFAFDEFDKFDNSSDSGAKCNRMIMLLTDGGTDDAEKVFNERNFKRPDEDQVRVFTYAVGQTANPNRGIRWMACANRGKFSEIPAMGAIRARVQGYVDVIARPVVLSNRHDMKWNSVYRDGLGLGMMTTVTLPVYNKTDNADRQANQTILGVMGTDVTTAQMEKYTPVWKLGPNGYSFAINANGYVMFHPKLRVHDDFKDPPNMDFLDIEVENKEKEETKSVGNQLRKNMTDGITGDASMVTYVISADNNHTDQERRHYFYRNIKSTSFSLGLSIPSYQKYTMVFTSTPKDIVKSGTPFIEDNKSIVLVAPWKYVKNGSLASNLSDIYSSYKKWEKSGKDDGFWDNEKLLTLHMDLEKTEHMHEFFNQFMLNRTEAIFVATYGGLTRIVPTGSKYKEKIEKDRDTWKASYFKRALDYDGLVFSAPYTLKERTENDTEPIPDIMITKSVTVTAYNYKPAVIGSFVKHEKIVEILGTETDQNCGVDSSIDCYLLDDGAFLISSNREEHFDEVGRFFGKVDPLLMHELYNISVYQRLEDFDYQATCSLNDSITSSAIRLRIPSINILFELLTVNWWSSIWTWWVSNLSFYSWLNAPVVETANAPEVNKNCIKRQAQYYIPTDFSEIEGVIECINVNCTRNYKAIKLNNSKLKSNLMFVMVDAKCDGCLEEKSGDIDLLQEPKVFEKESEHFCNKQARYRRVTEPCYDYHEKEESDCSGPLSTPVSVAVIVIATIVTVLCTWIR
ncbi:voltage-dependent calcium channel subunit alpha-2/delta-2-like isoform X3 [Mytilus edulis]|uniref:voltage-dependent calcium channel subunit alpha-2/delta-2-like isoform X3 n=1 Tax=Mytilus edulis TaxID=6550 RepID=UPI0039EEF107